MVAYRLNLNEGSLIGGRYQVVKRIGFGSYGDVFKATDMMRDHLTVALKIQRLWEIESSFHQTLLTKFEKEYLTSKIESDYLVHAMDYGNIEGNPFIVMEFCKHGDLSNITTHDCQKIANYACDILMGLDALHRNGKVHRDLKPQNVLIKDSGIAALTDFGIVGDSKKRDSERGFFRKRPIQAVGTYAYMSPEQADKKGGGVTYLPTTDIFSFGVMLYELLLGFYPFGKLESEEDLKAYRDCINRGIWNKNALIPIHQGYKWLHVLTRCLATDYRERYHNVASIIRDIKSFMDVDENRANFYINKRSLSISKLVISQGGNVGAEFYPSQMLHNGVSMLKFGREKDNDVVLYEIDETYSSRYHFTLMYLQSRNCWIVKDGQWRPNMRQWVNSTNGTFVNAQPVNEDGILLYTGDVITAGEVKMKVE